MTVVKAQTRLVLLMGVATWIAAVSPEDMARLVNGVLDWSEKVAIIVQGQSPAFVAAFEPVLMRVIRMFGG